MESLVEKSGQTGMQLAHRKPPINWERWLGFAALTCALTSLAFTRYCEAWMPHFSGANSGFNTPYWHFFEGGGYFLLIMGFIAGLVCCRRLTGLAAIVVSLLNVALIIVNMSRHFPDF